jgi:hypothetical protein
MSQIILLTAVKQESAKTQNGLVSKDTSPSNFNFQNSPPHSLPTQPAVELAEGIEPPTL